MNAFAASYDFVEDEICFGVLPIKDGCLVDGDTNPSLLEIEQDGYSPYAFVTDDEFENGVEDTPELRQYLSDILNRRFEYLRERAKSSANVRHIKEIQGLTVAQMLARSPR